MSADRKVPEIRFKGYSGEWKISELYELALFNPKKELPDSFKYVDLESVKGTSLIGYRVEIRTKAPSRAQRLAQKGDVFYQTVRPYQKNNYLFNKDSDDYVFSTGYAQLRPYFDGHFLLNLVQRDRFVKQVLDNCTGTSYPAINALRLATLEVSYPDREDEQTQIGGYFQKLDTLINQHQNKHDKLCNIKKAMLEKMFPKQGETIPEIRFKGFSGEWEEIKFKDMAEIKRGLTYKPTDLVDEGVVVLRSSNINIDKFELRKDDVQVDKKAVNINYINNGDILITSANGSSQLVGKHAVVKNLNIDSVHGGFMLAVTTNAPDFLNASMNTYWYNRFLSMNVSGGNGAIGNIKGSILEEEQLYVPKKDERDKIGNYLQKLDNLINQHQQQITKLKNIKQACLSKMFV